MRLKYSSTFIEAQAHESPIADLCWSPNNVKLAVATCDRLILLFDASGVRRDKFSTKPADPQAGKKSYVITGVAFSGNSELLGVAQSDSMVFVYRVGADWSGKKVICNKFPLSGAPVAILATENAFVAGTTEGKVRSLDCKNNKSTSLWSSHSSCVALARSPSDAQVCSGHGDGTIYVNGRLLLKYAFPPTALLLVPPYIVLGACDGRIAIYDANRGTLIRSIECAQLPPERREIIKAAGSPSGQTVAFGVFDGYLLGELKDNGAFEVSMVKIPNLYACRALAWSGDGTKLAIGNQSGAVLVLEAVLRRWVWREAVEVRHVSARRLLLTRLAGDAPPLSVLTKLGADIFSVRFVGNDWYAICRTNNSLILCDIARGLTSEIEWAGGGERVYAAVGGACLLQRAGELSLVEYGLDRVLHTVRTERVNPHVLSVRINEARTKPDAGADAVPGTRDIDNKKLAYLLDKQTVAVVDLVSGESCVQIGQWWHEARIDWLELSEAGDLLLFRDTRRRLVLLKIESGEKEVIASGVGFVQWVENSDAIVAQTPTHLLVWYSAWDSARVELVESGGGVAVGIQDGKVLLAEGQLPCAHLDQHRLAFNGALRTGDLEACARYLAGVRGAELGQLWRQLADKAVEANDLELAVKCYKELGDEARTYFLEQTVELARREGAGDVQKGVESYLVRARLAILAGELPAAEEWYVRAGRADLALGAYTALHRWPDAVALAERTDPARAQQLRDAHMDYLTSTGRLGEAGAAMVAAGEVRGAVRLWVRGGRARRAAALLLQHAALLHDGELADNVHAQLVKEEWWEIAGELSEKRGDVTAAIDYYAKGHNYARAVQLARQAAPGEVTRLEGEWGAWLASSRQAGAAVTHLIEAGDTRAALAAALKAHHYKKALQILHVIDDKQSIREQCEQLAEHFISMQEWETAEEVLGAAGLAEKCVRAYNAAGKFAEGLRFAAKHLTEEETRELYLPLAQKLKDEGQLRKAEQIYIGLGEVDEAISMYKAAAQYEQMLRLVGAHRGELLAATRRHVAQALHAAGDLRAAEHHYLQAGDWKSAIQMYRGAGEWESAERVARAHAPAAVQQQVALLWAAALGGGPGARLLAARGLASLGAQWAVQAQRWDLALELSEVGGGMSRREVCRQQAAALAAEQPAEAEAAYLRAGAPDDAVHMWLQLGQPERALALAEAHAPHMVEEALIAGAKAAASRGDLADFEALIIRANRPQDVVQHYKELEMWEEAMRVSREYLPDGSEPVPAAVPPLLQQAALHADNGEWWEAVECLSEASGAGAAGGARRLAERAALRAARLARDHLDAPQRARAAHLLHQRFLAIGQPDVADQLRQALTSHLDADEGHGSADSGGEEEEVARGGVGGRGGDREVGAGVGTAELERLAAAGHWQRCLALADARAPHYALRYAQHLFNVHPREEGLSEQGEGVELPEVVAGALEALRRAHAAAPTDLATTSDADRDATLAHTVCTEVLARVSAVVRAPYEAVAAAREAVLAAGGGARLVHAAVLLSALHVPALRPRVARALPRYSDLLVADVVYYLAGSAVRSEGAAAAREAFVLLNRCLDLVEAADDQTPHLLDYDDFENTDYAREPLLLKTSCVRGASLSEVREWVLTTSMDQAIEQSLPVDGRGLYEACLSGGGGGGAGGAGAEEPCCVITGYPLGARLVTFTNGRCANRESWSRLVAASRSDSAAADLMSFVTLWCGPADYRTA